MAYLLTEKQLAYHLGYSDRTIRNMMKRGELDPSAIIGGRPKFIFKEVIEQLKKNGKQQKNTNTN